VYLCQGSSTDAVIPLLLRLLKCDAARAIAALVAIPVVMIGTTAMAFSINPEASLIGPFHVRNYWLLYELRRTLLRSIPLAVAGLWFLTCVFVVRAKGRSYAWATLGLIGPFGLIALTMLGNKTSAGGGRYNGWVRRKYWPVRAAYQVALFVVVVIAADRIIALKRPLVIWWQSYVTGYPVEEILRQQDASSGMWAFGELLETIFLVVLFYLLWPICFNAASWLRELRARSRA
jgi:hypothetical protein